MSNCLDNYNNLIKMRFHIQVKYLTLCLLLIKSYIISCDSINQNVKLPDGNTTYFRNSRNVLFKSQNSDLLKQIFELTQNKSLPMDKKNVLEQIYGKIANDEITRSEQLTQISSWLSGEDIMRSLNQTSYLRKSDDNVRAEYISGDDLGIAQALKAEKSKTHQMGPQHQHQPHQQNSANTKQIESQTTHSQNEEEVKEDTGSDNYESNDDENTPSGTTKAPPCAHYGRYYCSYKEDYPIKVVTEVTKYYKWPLEKLFRDLRHQVMPTLANDNSGGLVCDSITRIIRPGWAKNTDSRWLVVINTEHYPQYVTEVICRHGTGSYCNFIPPCYHSSCRQRYNTQKLLVIDPWNPYKGPFLSEFLFPSCCVCFIPADNTEPTNKDKLTAVHPNHQMFIASASSSPVDVSSLSP